MRTIILTAVVAAVVAGVLGFTQPGHQLLYKTALTTACGSDSGCD